MAAEEDNFDIDIYGDDANHEYGQDAAIGDDMKQEHEEPASTASPQRYTNGRSDLDESKGDANPSDQSAQGNERNQISSTGGSAQNQVQPPKQAPIQQGTKRKEGADDRPNDPGATSALLIQDLHWWTTEDDVRGWANQAGCEDELKAVTFNEHKVNGKSKGQVYIEMASSQAATALKHKIDSYGEGQPHMKKPSITYNPPHINPYKTIPKDVPKRDNRGDNRSMSGNFGSQGMHNKFNQGGFQGRGGYNNQNRGGSNQMGFSGRNFSNPNMGGMSQSGGFNGPMANFGNNPMGGMQQFGNFNRGNMMGGMRGGMQNRGGRGGMNPNMMSGMGMGGMGNMNMGMPMGGMGGNMNMGMGNMGAGFGGGQGHFNPAFFNQSQQGGGSGDQWNPHGAKRPRPE